MMRTPILSRRALIAGMAASIAAFPRLYAQIPLPNNHVNPAYNLRDTLAIAPITSYEGVLLEPVRWIGTSASPYLSSVGGVHVLITDRSAAPFGSYVVYRDDAGASSGLFLGKRALENKAIDTFQETIHGYRGDVITYDDRSPHAIALVPVGNVLIIGNDTIVNEEPGQSEREHAERAIDHASVLIGHLQTIIDGRN